MNRKQSGVKIGHAGEDIHGRDGAHQESAVITPSEISGFCDCCKSQKKCRITYELLPNVLASVDGVRLYKTICVQGKELHALGKNKLSG